MYRSFVWTMMLLVLVWGGARYASSVQAQVAESLCEPAKAAVETGQSEQFIEFDGETRRFLVYVPASYDPAQQAPLVLSFHGFASNPQQQADFSQWNGLADEAGFIVVYPQGTGFPLRWNAGETPFAGLRGADDVGFVRALIVHLSDTLCIDPLRIYANGLSNGGGMSSRLACELSDQLTAVGGVAGAYSALPEGCHPVRPVPIIAFHGTADPIVPYGGSRRGFVLPSIREWASDWAALNGCNDASEPILATGDASGVRYIGCQQDAEVILYTIDGGGHTWPGGPPISERLVGKTSQDINASAVMWGFFTQHALTAGN